MRVLHVVSTGQRRGAEVFAADLARLLRRAGVDQRVAVLYGTPPFDVDYGVPVLALAGERRPRWARRALLLRREHSEWGPDVVQAHGGDALKYAVSADPRRRRPLVHRNIGMAAPWATRGARRRVHSFLMRRADKVVAVADIVARETVHTFGVPPHRVVAVPNGIDVDRLRPAKDRAEVRRSLDLPADASVALWAGSLSWEKDPLTLVEVAARLAQAGTDAYFLLAGDGPLRPDVESSLRSRQLAGRVRVLGSRADVADLLGTSDLLVSTSRAGGMEGIPAIVIEAGMAGLPVAGYDVGGVSEVVSNGVTGVLAPPGDVDSLVAGVGRLLHVATRRTMGEAARERCLEHFDLGTLVAQYLSVYAEVTSSHRRR